MYNVQFTMKTEWAHKKLIDLADYYNGMAFKPSDWVESGTKIIRIEQLNNPLGNYDYYQGSYPEINAIHNEDLIFSWSATLKVAIWKWGEGVLNQHLFKVVPFENVDKYFLYYLLDYNMPKLGESSHGSTMKHIKRKELETYSVKIPTTLSVQRRIAVILSSADKVIDSTRRLIEKYKKMKQGMMKELLNEQCTMNNVQWRKVRLGEVGDFYVGGDVDRSCFSPYPTVECRFPIYANALVNEGLYGYSSKYEFDKEAVTITGRGDVGKVFYRKPYFTTIIRLVTLIPTDSNIDVKFLSYAMSKINFIIESTGVPQLTAPQAKKYEVSVPYKNGKPDLTEQRRIASILSGIDAKIAAEEKVLEKYTLVKKGLMEKLLNNN